MTGLPTLDLNELATGNIPALTPAMGAALAEAAGVCLEWQGHTPGVRLTIRGASDSGHVLTWQPTAAQAQRSWNDRSRAVEMGAEGIAILIARPAIGYDVIRRARQGTGFDYWIGERVGADFVPKAGLEVSGIYNGSESDIRARVREKLQQANQSGAQTWETYVTVVEFGRPLAEVQKNDL